MSGAPGDKKLKQIADAAVRLGYQLCLDQDHNRNVILSPLGIISSLAVLCAGARGRARQQLARKIGGDRNDKVLDRLASLLNELKGRSQLTEYEANVVRRRQAKREALLAQGMDPQEVERELYQRLGSIGLDSHADLKFVLSVASGMWVQHSYPCNPAFLERARDTLDAHVEMLDFQGKRDEASATINAWVQENTQGFINSVVAPTMLPPLLRLVLANVVYFKAPWAKEFGSPRPGPFYLFDETPIEAQMISKRGSFRYTKSKDCHAVVLPYKRRPVSMVLVLPRVPGKRALVELERKLEQGMHNQLLAAASERDVALTIPEFDTEFREELVPLLARHGLEDVFARGDFSGISAEQGFGVDSIIHQARIRVDRYGTEAAAAIMVIYAGSRLLFPEHVELTIDRPFLFSILDEPTGIVLFVGRIANPG